VSDKNDMHIDYEMHVVNNSHNKLSFGLLVHLLLFVSAV